MLLSGFSLPPASYLVQELPGLTGFIGIDTRLMLSSEVEKACIEAIGTGEHFKEHVPECGVVPRGPAGICQARTQEQQEFPWLNNTTKSRGRRGGAPSHAALTQGGTQQAQSQVAMGRWSLTLVLLPVSAQAKFGKQKKV